LSTDSPFLRLHFHTRYERRGKQRWRVYSIHTSDGTPCMTAEARRVPGPLRVCAAPTGDEIVAARPRRSFPLSGRYDVMQGGTRIGVITRTGRIRDADGNTIARFRDARSLKEHVGEGVLTMVVEGMLGGDSGAGVGPGPSGYVLMGKESVLGTLRRGRLPFTVDEPPAEPRRVVRAVERVRRVLRVKSGARHPSGWTLELPDEAPIAEPLLLAAAMLAIEIALW
jgi:hypothetical protein